MAISQNQFALQPIQGNMDLRMNNNTIAAQIDSSSAGNLVPGQAVKLVQPSGGNQVPKVVECAVNSDPVFGFINYDIKQASFQPYAAVQLSAFQDNCMYMTASAAIAAGAQVAIVIAGSMVVTATTGMTIVGQALDAASGAGSVIRVVIQLPGALHA